MFLTDVKTFHWKVKGEESLVFLKAQMCAWVVGASLQECVCMWGTKCTILSSSLPTLTDTLHPSRKPNSLRACKDSKVTKWVPGWLS